MFGLGDDDQDKNAGTFGTFKAIADILRNQGEYDKAIKNYTLALKKVSDDQICLVNRSKCYLLLGENAKALKDAEASLVEDKLYHKGIFQKAEALFNQGNFEMALMFYHRGHNVRPELHNFRIGIRKAQEAIYNCVGTPDRVKLTTAGDLTFFDKMDKQKVRKKGARCTQKKTLVLERVKPVKRRSNEPTIKQMLGELYGDKLYLETLIKGMDDHTTTGRAVRSVAQTSLHYLEKQSDFWQQVKPVYARKYEARLALNRAKSSRIASHDYVIHELRRIDALLMEKRYECAMKKSLKLLALLEGYSESRLASKMIFLAAVHSAIGSAYLELMDFENAEKHHLLDLTIGEDCYINESESRALDNLGRVYFGDGKFQKAIDVWEKKLLISKKPLELTWLYHELGRCNLALGDFEKAKTYGVKSLSSSQEAKDDRWQLHGLVLISQAEVKSGRLSSSLVTFEKALELALLLNDREAHELVTKAISEVDAKLALRELNLERYE